MPHPDLTLLAAIAAVGFAKHPIETRSYTAEELRVVSCKQLDPETGMKLEVVSGFPPSDAIAVIAHTRAAKSLHQLSAAIEQQIEQILKAQNFWESSTSYLWFVSN